MKAIAKYKVLEKVTVAAEKFLYVDYMNPNEKVVLSYRNLMQRIIFTDSKIIAIDFTNTRGLGPRFMFLHYHNISSFSVEEFGLLNSECEFKILVKNMGVFEICFGERIECREIGQFLNQAIFAKEMIKCG